MCRRLEDCLVSRTGFRVFIVSVLVLLVTALGLNLSYKFLLPELQGPSANRNEALQSTPSSDHHILLWTPLDGSWSSWWNEGILGRTDRSRIGGCSQLARCSFSSDRTRLNSSHLVLYSYTDLDPGDTPPKYSGAGQRWGLFLPTPPSTRHSGPAWQQLLPMFDILISYFPLSSIQMYQGRTVHISSPEGLPSDPVNATSPYMEQSQYELNFRHLFRQMMARDEGGGQDSDFEKQEVTRRHRHADLSRRRRAFQQDSRLVATLIDDCHTDSNREGYIEAMSEHVNIHIYGDCGAPCPGGTKQACLDYLSRFYKFLLVFEPYMCQHFLSDLIWAVLSTDMVPVVFGGVSYSKLLPRGSYIDALNQSPKNLAHFLRYLDRSEELYSNYLLWKDSYRVETQSWLCQLCSSLDPGLDQLALPPTQVSMEPPTDRCTTWPELKFGLNHKGAGRR